MISEGYEKPYNKYFCNQLISYQQKNFEAIRVKKGPYSAENRVLENVYPMFTPKIKRHCNLLIINALNLL